MAWSGTVDDAHKIPERKRMVKVQMTLTNGRTGSVVGAFQRRDVITTERWVGIQHSVAFNYVDAESTVASIEDVSAERMNDAGAYSVTKETVTEGTWY